MRSSGAGVCPDHQPRWNAALGSVASAVQMSDYISKKRVPVILPRRGSSGNGGNSGKCDRV
jgi:hypothetical protein